MTGTTITTATTHAPEVGPHGKTEKNQELSMARTEDLSDEAPCPVGIATNRGGKANQEDAYYIGGRTPDRMTLNGYAGPISGTFGVFDGHGGDRASRYCAEHAFARFHEEIATATSIESALSAAVRRVDEEFCDIARRTERMVMMRAPSIERLPLGVGSAMGVEDGSTLLMAIIFDGCVYVANVGDSRSILTTKAGRFYPMSIDQKPNRKDERDRLEAKGAFITGAPAFVSAVWPMSRFVDVPRVNGTLAMSRSIGDVSLKQWITSDPEVTMHKVTKDDQFLILATDGLWDVISSRAVAKMATKYSEAQALADALIKYALDHGTADNTTVIVADVQAYT